MAVEEAFAAWRLKNPGEAGWPLVAFCAGWEARGAELLRVTTMQERGENPLFCGVDMSEGQATVVIMRRREDGGLEVLGETAVRLPTSEALRRDLGAYSLHGLCRRPGGCLCGGDAERIQKACVHWREEPR